MRSLLEAQECGGDTKTSHVRVVVRIRPLNPQESASKVIMSVASAGGSSATPTWRIPPTPTACGIGAAAAGCNTSRSINTTCSTMAQSSGTEPHNESRLVVNTAIDSPVSTPRRRRHASMIPTHHRRLVASPRTFSPTIMPRLKNSPSHSSPTCPSPRTPGTSSTTTMNTHTPRPPSPRMHSPMGISIPSPSASLWSNNAPGTRLYVESPSLSRRDFEFDAVFPPSTSQQQLYEHSIGDAVVTNIFRGYNTTIFAYGQTGSGKTYTMGPLVKQPSVVTDSEGILLRTIRDLFRGKAEAEERFNVTIALNCLELLNDEFRDLLIDRIDQPSPSIRLRNLGTDVVVEGVTHMRVHSIEHTNELIRVAASRRATAATLMNDQSSRSHAIYTFLVNLEPKSIAEIEGDSMEGPAADRYRSTPSTPLLPLTAKLTLVDLAGSEQIKRSGVMGNQQKESININKDLFVLGKVVSTLAEISRGSMHTNHVPYRDSKLTQLLQDSLGEFYAEETLNTLRYAERARSIANNLKQNAIRTLVVCSAETEALRSENDRLRAELKDLRKRLLYVGYQIGVRCRSGTVGSFEKQLHLLQNKLTQAEDSARDVREASLTVSRMADKWSRHKTVALTKNSSEGSSNVGVQLQLNPSDKSVGDWSSCGTESLDVTAAESDSVPESRSELVTEWNTLCEQVDMKRSELAQLQTDIAQQHQRLHQICELEDLSERVEAKRSEHEQITNEMELRLATIREEVIMEESKRNELAKEVNEMKCKIHLLAVDLQDKSGQSGLQSLFRSLSGGTTPKSCTVGDVEMQKIRSLYQSKELQRIKELEQQMQLEQNRANSIINDYASLKEKVEELSQENSLLKQTITERCELENARNDAVEKEQLLHEIEGLRQENERLRVKVEWTGNNRADEITGRLLQENEVLRKQNEALQIENVKTKADSVKTAQEVEELRQAVSLSQERRSSNIYKDSKFMSFIEKAINQDPKDASLERPIPEESDGFEFDEPNSQSHTSYENEVFISNMNQIGRDPLRCSCETAKLFGKKEHVDFYLPKIDVSCSCGNKTVVSLPTGSDPADLSNILRDWQVEFLYSLGITETQVFIRECMQRRQVLAKELRRWRKSKAMASMKTSACAVALYIWCRTCKAVMKKISQQKAMGVERPVRPSFLDVCLMSDSASMSTIGII